MKTIQVLFLFVLSFFTTVLTAQTEDKKPGFGGFSLVNTSFAGEWALETGGIGGAFINENFYLGGGGFGLSQEKTDYEYDMGYGGVMLGYLWGDNKKTALNFHVLGGYGGIRENGNDIEKKSSDFWVIKPGIEVDFLIASWLRFGVGGGYRWVMNSNIPSLNSNELSSSYGSITFRFGNWK